MGRPRKPAQPQRSAADDLGNLAPLPLDPATVAAAGIVRAAVDAVNAHPTVRARVEEATGDRAAMARVIADSATLTRLSAEHCARTHPQPSAATPDTAPF